MAVATATMVFTILMIVDILIRTTLWILALPCR